MTIRLANDRKGRDLELGGEVDCRSDKIRGVVYLERRPALLHDLLYHSKSQSVRNLRFLISANMARWTYWRAKSILRLFCELYEDETSQYTLRESSQCIEVVSAFYNMVGWEIRQATRQEGA